MKKIIVIFIVVLCIATFVYGSSRIIGPSFFRPPRGTGVPPAMDGVIANPATVKIANPAGQNLSIN